MTTNGSREYLTDIGVLCLWGILAVLSIVLPVVRESIVRALVAGSFVVFAPGYALLAALYVRDGQLSVLERGVFSVGASLALVGLVGLLLAEVPALGIRLETVLGAQLLLVGVFLTICVFRRRAIEPEERAVPARGLLGGSRRAWAGRSAVGGGSTAVQVAIVLAVLASLGATVFVVATPLPSEEYTEFYVLGPDGSAETIPETVAPDEEIELLVGAANHEHRTVEYELQVQTRGADPAVVATDSWRLDHEAVREEPFVFEPTGDDETVVLEFLLFYDGGGAPAEVVDPETADRHVTVRVRVESA
jgi:uncharacterized membrane protein